MSAGRGESQHLRLYQPVEIFIGEPHRLIMSAGAKRDFFVLRQVLVYKYRHVEKISEWRHRAGFASRETRPECRFAGQFNLLSARSLAQAFEVDLKGCGQNGHRERIVHPDDDGLRQVLPLCVGQ